MKKLLLYVRNAVMNLSLKMDWCSHDGARFAVENWHYSKVMPTGKTVKVGAWEDEKFVGVIIFSYGANNNAAKMFGLNQQKVCELTRVALTSHKAPVSKILSIALSFLSKSNPGIDVVFSYADKTNQRHHGGIYQANGWLYLGERKTSNKGAYYVIYGKKIHGRSARAKYKSEKFFPKGWSHYPSQTKHLYVKILNKKYVLLHKILTYPKRAGSDTLDTPSNHEGKGGSLPTPALQYKTNE